MSPPTSSATASSSTTAPSSTAAAGTVAARQLRTDGFDVARVRAEFPALRQSVGGHPLVYLDSAATSQKPRSVLEAVTAYYERDNANVHRAIHTLGVRATEAYEEARQVVARFLGAPETREIVFVRGTTEAINLVAASWGRANLRPQDEVLLSVMEHHSNLVDRKSTRLNSSHSSPSRMPSSA